MPDAALPPSAATGAGRPDLDRQHRAPTWPATTLYRDGDRRFIRLPDHRHVRYTDTGRCRRHHVLLSACRAVDTARQRERPVTGGLRHRHARHAARPSTLRRHLRVRQPTARRSPPAWTLSGTPQRAEYDTARAKNGTLSGWIVGPTTAAAAGVSVPAVMTSNGAEYRFWLYADTANENRYVSDTGRSSRCA